MSIKGAILGGAGCCVSVHCHTEQLPAAMPQWVSCDTFIVGKCAEVTCWAWLRDQHFTRLGLH